MWSRLYVVDELFLPYKALRHVDSGAVPDSMPSRGHYMDGLSLCMSYVTE